MEHLLGHLVAFFMLRREMLSILCHCYVFALEAGERRLPAWPSVRHELEWARALLPLVVARCKLQWSTRSRP